MRLYKTVLACTLGKGSTHPFRISFIRLGVLWILAISLGVGVAVLIPSLPQTSDNSWIQAASATYIIQLIVSITLLASYGVIRPGTNDGLGKLLQILPISRRSHWLALLLPSFVLNLLTISFVGPVWYVIMSHQHVVPVMLCMALIIGASSAFGLIYGWPRRYRYLQWAAFPICLWVGYKALQILHNPASSSYERIVAGNGFTALVVIEILLFICSTHITAEAAAARSYIKIYATFLPSRLWFQKKIWRSHITRTGLLITLLMSSVIAYICNHYHFTDVTILAGLVSLMVAALSSDIRTTSRRKNPAEITMVRGTFYFGAKQLCSVTLLSLLSVSPVLGVILLGGDVDASQLGQICIQIFLGISCGVFASSLIAPAGRDVTAQSGATLLASGVLIFPQLPFISTLTASTVMAIKVALMGSLLAASYVIEYKRNPYTWRKTRVIPN